jgi:hypothetical protein
MERLIVLPHIKNHVLAASLNLADYKDIPTEELKHMRGSQRAGAGRISPTVVTTIAFLLGTRLLDPN